MAKRALVKAQLDNLKSGTPFNAETAKKANLKSRESARRNKSAKRVFSMLLESLPQLDDRTRDTLTKLGIKDIDDTDTMTLIGAAMVQKAIRGDNRAAQFVFKIAGQDGDSEIMRERNAIEREKLKLEREKLEAIRASQAPGTSKENSLIDALTEAARAGLALVADTPENADSGDANEE